METLKLNKLFITLGKSSLVIFILFLGMACVEKNKNSSAHRTSSLLLLAELQSTETSVFIKAYMHVDDGYNREYEIRLTGRDVIYAVDSVRKVRLRRNSKEYIYAGEITDLVSRRVQLQFERGSDKYEDALNTTALLPMPALVYLDQRMSHDQSIVIDWRLDPELPLQTKLSGTLNLLECDDSEDEELLAPYFPKSYETAVYEGVVESVSTKYFLPAIELQPKDYECQFSLQVRTSAPGIAVDPSFYFSQSDMRHRVTLIVSEALSDSHVFTIRRASSGASL